MSRLERPQVGKDTYTIWNCSAEVKEQELGFLWNIMLFLLIYALLNVPLS